MDNEEEYLVEATYESYFRTRLGADHGTIRTFNRQLILNYLRINGPRSRVAISRALGISRATVSSIVEDLERSQVVYEGEKIGARLSGAMSKGGKRATQVYFNINAGYIVGIDLGRSRLRIYLTNLRPEIIDQVDYSFDIRVGGENTLDFIANKIKKLVASNFIDWSRVRGIGLSIPGTLDPTHPMLISPHLNSWSNLDIPKVLRNNLGLGQSFPIYLDRDANMGVLGESRYGAGAGLGNIIYIKLSNGISAGLFLNGELYRGNNGAAGEFGHVLIENSSNLQCFSCGKQGCLEALAGLQAIVDDARKNSTSPRVQSFKDVLITPEHMADIIIAAQEEGDIGSRDVLERAGVRIGRAIGSYLINIYNPSKILLDGGIVRPSKEKRVYKNEFLLHSLYQSAESSSMPVTWAGTQILEGQLGDDAVGFGTVATVIDNDEELNMPRNGNRFNIPSGKKFYE